MHLNIQSLCSLFDEFPVYLHTYCFDVMTETWLKNKHKLEYVKHQGKARDKKVRCQFLR